MKLSTEQSPIVEGGEEENDYSALLDEHENECTLDCGCRMWRDGEAFALKFCAVHDSVSPWSKAAPGAGSVQAGTVGDWGARLLSEVVRYWDGEQCFPFPDSLMSGGKTTFAAFIDNHEALPFYRAALAGAALPVDLFSEMSDFIRRMAVNALPGSSGAAREEAGKLFARVLAVRAPACASCGAPLGCDCYEQGGKLVCVNCAS